MCYRSINIDINPIVTVNDNTITMERANRVLGEMSPYPAVETVIEMKYNRLKNLSNGVISLFSSIPFQCFVSQHTIVKRQVTIIINMK